MMKAGFYIHIPFCLKKCGYCDFYSTQAEPGQITAFLHACADEIELYREHPVFSQVEFQTLYLGGGTPSLLSARQINELIEELDKNFSFENDFEFTIEANPETISLEKLKAYRAIGINRISIGIQSFSDAELKILDRVHSASQAVKSIEWAFQAGFENINLDLIFAIPGQTLSQWQDNLKKAIVFSPQHISVYGLTIEPGTAMDQQINTRQIEKVAEEIEREMYLWNIASLRAAGYEQYEISNFSQPGCECRHNQMYWNGSPYLGIGPSAHSFWERHRQWNVASIHEYSGTASQGKKPIRESEELSATQTMLEFIYLSLRTAQGIDTHQFEQQFQISFMKKFHHTLETLNCLVQEQLFLYDTNRLKLTAPGFVLFDEICQLFANEI
ncbi:MAG: radical SAM family heme chaperone HemW [bacterium]|jgi:oxygen-independent coproporphyrinogen-3 oxidase|nr:radical SAM family heme chaperone HemW [bacterium]